MLKETKEMQRQSLLDRTAKLDETARMLAKSFEGAEPNSSELAGVAAAGSLVHIGIVAENRSSLASYDRELSSDERIELDRILSVAKQGNTADPTLRDGKGLDVGIAALSGGRMLMVVPDPFGERTLSKVVEKSAAEFEDLKEKQVTIRRMGLLTLGVLTFLLMFASTWIAFYVARGLTAPIKAG